MRFAIVLFTLVALMSTIAMAGEKVPDTNNDGYLTSSRSSLDGVFDEYSPKYERPFGDGVSLECANPMTDSYTTENLFAMFCITATDANPIEITVDAALTELGDTTITLYCDPFDYTDPLTNVVSYDDDAGEGLLSAFLLSDNITLTPGDQYYLVLSNFGTGDPDDMGAFELNWGSMKAYYR